VPYHLTTREFNEQIAGLLTENGIYAVNVVDKFQSGEFARAFVSTLKETFPYVYVIREDGNWPDDRQKTHVVAASKQPLTYEAIKAANLEAGRGEPVSHFMPEETLTGWLGNRENVLLTDDHAPVDNMLAALHLEGTGSSKANRHYNDGVEFEAQGRTQDSIAAYSRAIDLEPGLAQAYVNRGSIFYRTGLYQRAIQDLGQAITLEPNHPDARLNRGAVNLALGQYEKAVTDLDEAIRLAPGSAAAHYNRALSDFHLGQYSRSVEDYTQAIRFDPKHALAYADRSIAHTILGADGQAEADFQRAVELGIESSDLLRQEIDQRRSQR
jgi:tetratricopeptide (TPR) repeat protein